MLQCIFAYLVAIATAKAGNITSSVGVAPAASSYTASVAPTTLSAAVPNTYSYTAPVASVAPVVSTHSQPILLTAYSAGVPSSYSYTKPIIKSVAPVSYARYSSYPLYSGYGYRNGYSGYSDYSSPWANSVYDNSLGYSSKGYTW